MLRPGNEIFACSAGPMAVASVDVSAGRPVSIMADEKPGDDRRDARTIVLHIPSELGWEHAVEVVPCLTLLWRARCPPALVLESPGGSVTWI